MKFQIIFFCFIKFIRINLNKSKTSAFYFINIKLKSMKNVRCSRFISCKTVKIYLFFKIVIVQ